MVCYKINLKHLGERVAEVRVKKIRRCYLRVYPDGSIKASVPLYLSRASIETFLADNIDWIINKVNIAEKKACDNKVYYLGQGYEPVIYRANRFSFERADGKLKLFSPRNVDAINTYYKSLKDEAYALYKDIMEEYCRKYNIHIPLLKVRSMVSWGLYNKRTDLITVNVKLLQADLECIRMVIFHELCHVLEQNHSKEFYKLLMCEFPDYKKIRARLNAYNTRKIV